MSPDYKNEIPSAFLKIYLHQSQPAELELVSK